LRPRPQSGTAACGSRPACACGSRLPCRRRPWSRRRGRAAGCPARPACTRAAAGTLLRQAHNCRGVRAKRRRGAPVIQDHVGGVHELRGAQREQARVAGTGAHQVHGAWALCASRSSLSPQARPPKTDLPGSRGAVVSAQRAAHPTAPAARGGAAGRPPRSRGPPARRPRPGQRCWRRARWPPWLRSRPRRLRRAEPACCKQGLVALQHVRTAGRPAGARWRPGYKRPVPAAGPLRLTQNTGHTRLRWRNRGEQVTGRVALRPAVSPRDRSLVWPPT